MRKINNKLFDLSTLKHRSSLFDPNNDKLVLSIDKFSPGNDYQYVIKVIEFAAAIDPFITDIKLEQVTFTDPSTITFTMSDNSTIDLDVSTLQNYSAGEALNLTGTTFDVLYDNNTIKLNGLNQLYVDTDSLGFGGDIFLQSSTYDSETNILTLTLTDGNSYAVDLNGIIQPYTAGDAIDSDTLSMDNIINVLYDNNTIKLNQANQLYVDVEALNVSDEYVNSLSFDSDTSILTLNRVLGSPLTVDLSSLQSSGGTTDINITGFSPIDVIETSPDNFSISMVPGTSGQILTTDGASNITWEDQIYLYDINLDTNTNELTFLMNGGAPNMIVDLTPILPVIPPTLSLGSEDPIVITSGPSSEDKNFSLAFDNTLKINSSGELSVNESALTDIMLNGYNYQETIYTLTLRRSDLVQFTIPTYDRVWGSLQYNLSSSASLVSGSWQQLPFSGSLKNSNSRKFTKIGTGQIAYTGKRTRRIDFNGSARVAMEYQAASQLTFELGYTVNNSGTVYPLGVLMPESVNTVAQGELTAKGPTYSLSNQETIGELDTIEFLYRILGTQGTIPSAIEFRLNFTNVN